MASSKLRPSDVPPGTRRASVEGIHRALEEIRDFWEQAEMHHRVQAAVGVLLSTSGGYALEYVIERGPLRIGDLARLLDLDLSTVSRLAGTLLETGLIVREADPADGRAVLLRASDRGIELGRKMRELWSSFLGGAVESWADDELAQLASGLQRLETTLGAMLPSEGRRRPRDRSS